MLETIDSFNINEWLRTMGPKISLTESPLFRLVWSDDMYELRTGTYAIFDKTTGAKLSESTRTENVLKYNYIKERWILEQWFPPQVVMNPELPNSKSGSYEPVYVFESAAGNALPLALQIVQIWVKNSMKPKTSQMHKRSLYNAIQEEREKQADKQDWEVLNDEGPLVSQFHDGSAILNIGDNNAVS